MVQKIVLLILFFTVGTAGIASKRISGCSATCMTLPSDDTLKKVDSIFSAKIVQIFEKKTRHRKISDPCVCGAGIGINIGIVKIKNILYDKGNVLQRHQFVLVEGLPAEAAGGQKKIFFVRKLDQGRFGICRPSLEATRANRRWAKRLINAEQLTTGKENS